MARNGAFERGNLKKLLLCIVLFNAFILIKAAEPAILVHNSLHEIEACKGKLKLKLIRTWGGDDEEDIHKFFKTPAYTVVDRNGRIYISDTYSHNVKVYDSSGMYIRTIG